MNMLFVCVGEVQVVVFGDYLWEWNILINVVLIVCLVMYLDVFCEQFIDVVVYWCVFLVC